MANNTIRTDTGKTVYPLAEHVLFSGEVAMLGVIAKYHPTWIHEYQDIKTAQAVRVGAVRTGEKRPPKAGEWYISGAIPEAYRQPHDGTSPQIIARLIKYRTEVTTRHVEVTL